MEPVISLSAEPIFYYGSFPVTNTLVLSLIISFCLIIFAVVFRSSIRRIPSTLQNIIEMIIEGAVDFIDSVVQDRKQAYSFFPVVFKNFVFVL